jgi:hypothetical protein
VADPTEQSRRLDTALKVVGVVGTLAGFLWGIYTYQDTSRKQLERERVEAARYAETRRIEATRPFLERQLKLYTEASQVAAKLAAPHDPGESAKARKRFWELYWGELALVEDRDVSAAMVAFGNALRDGGDRNELELRSLDLAHAFRDSLADSWNVRDWRRPGSSE